MGKNHTQSIKDTNPSVIASIYNHSFTRTFIHFVSHLVSRSCGAVAAADAKAPALLCQGEFQ